MGRPPRWVWPTFLVKIASRAVSARRNFRKYSSPNFSHEHVAQRLRGPGEHHVARGVVRGMLGPELLAALVHDPLAADDDHVLLQLVELPHPLRELGHVQGVLGDEDDVGLAVGGAEGDVAGMPAHHLDDGDAPMALGGGADAAHALGGDEHRRRVAGGRVVDEALEVERGARGHPLVVVARGVGRGLAHPFLGLAAIVEAQVVVDGLRSEHGREALREGLEAVQGAVAAHADEAFDAEAVEAMGDRVQGLRVVGVDVGPRGPDEGAPARGVELRDLGVERVQVDVGDGVVEEAAEALDEAEDLDPALVGAHHRALDGGVERRGVATRRQDPDPLHSLSRGLARSVAPGLAATLYGVLRRSRGPRSRPCALVMATIEGLAGRPQPLTGPGPRAAGRRTPRPGRGRSRRFPRAPRECR